MTARRRLFAPEVIQTSAMDCGPASLKCLFEGFGIDVSYSRLREACQTDIDGTSINTLEDVARALGLDASQIMLPEDHVLVADSEALPAIAVVRHPNGNTHFVVVWNCIGPFVQVMDPASGRRWKTRERFLSELHRHTFVVPASGWKAWASSKEAVRVLRRRILDLGASDEIAQETIARAVAADSWQPLAAADAAVRAVAALISSGAVRRGSEASRMLRHFLDADEGAIPRALWSVQETRPAEDGSEQLELRGAVLLRIAGASTVTSHADDRVASLSRVLRDAVDQRAIHPLREIWSQLREDELLNVSLLVAVWFATACHLVVQALLLRSVFGLASHLGTKSQMLGGMIVVVALTAILLLARLPSAIAVFRFGRRIEMRFRMAILRRIPRLGDRYFQSRLTADLAERSHSIAQVRAFPLLGSRIISSSFELTLTVAAIIWLDPTLWLFAIGAGLAPLVIPLAAQPMLSERDMRVRTHAGALNRFYLDSMLGISCIRAHSAEDSVRREQSYLLVEWSRATFDLLRAAVTIEGLLLAISTTLAALMLMQHLASSGNAGSALLLLYWALSLPLLGAYFSDSVRRYPQHRNIALRLLEAIHAPEAESASGETPLAAEGAEIERPAVSVEMTSVTVHVSGHTILDAIDLDVPAGAHLAIVGPSGAGKSTLVGLLLGWYQPTSGSLNVDGLALDPEVLEKLRSETAWVDPSIQLWNRSLLENMTYGAPAPASIDPGLLLHQADLLRVLQGLPEGMQSPLGEGGGLVSGGEGQRVRLARAMARPEARLVILDEPFRGLDRETRHKLLIRARSLWAGSTLLCVTHDLSETESFDRVVVVEDGRVTECGEPSVLSGNADSRYSKLLDTERDVRATAWGADWWRRIRLEEGRLVERS